MLKRKAFNQSWLNLVTKDVVSKGPSFLNLDVWFTVPFTHFADHGWMRYHSFSVWKLILVVKVIFWFIFRRFFTHCQSDRSTIEFFFKFRITFKCHLLSYWDIYTTLKDNHQMFNYLPLKNGATPCPLVYPDQITYTFFVALGK